MILIHLNQIIPLQANRRSHSSNRYRRQRRSPFGPLLNNFCTDSRRTCTKLIIIIILNTNIPNSSNRLLSTGHFCLNWLTYHLTSLCVVYPMTVHSKSSAESTKLAIKLKLVEDPAAIPLATGNKIFAITLMLIAYFASRPLFSASLAPRQARAARRDLLCLVTCHRPQQPHPRCRLAGRRIRGYHLRELSRWR